MKTPHGFWVTALLVGTVACGGCAKFDASQPPRAVFLIVVDTLRPDRLSCYGYQPHATPRIDALAESGVLFTSAHSVASWTVPSMGAMMTSLYPTQLGLIEEPVREKTELGRRKRRAQIGYTLAQGERTLAEMLGDAGFLPVGFVNQPFINNLDGFLQGFEAWCYPVNDRELAWHDPAQPIPDRPFPPGTELGRADALLVHQFNAWLEANAGTRPFVWLHLLTPHWPYQPPERYMPGYRYDWEITAPATERYDGECRAADDLVGAVLDAIDDHVGLDRSLVVFVSDHGEEFGEHGGVEHGHSLHREVTRVPLIVASPSLPAGRRVDAHVRTIDILPTILELTGVDPLETQGLEGTSLLPLMDGEADGRTVFSEGMLYGSTERSLISSGYKLMGEHNGGDSWKLYDVVTDPGETRDLAQTLDEKTSQMATTLETLHKRLVTDYASRNGLPATVQEDERVLRSLRALGYVNK